MAQAYETATVERVAEVVRWAKKGGLGGAALLLGAGVSASAGIPCADGIIADIRREFPTAFDSCSAKTSYPAVMACLSTGERRELIKGYVERANINWAYIAIAEMIKAGYVEYVLTTNFDPLLSRACALIGKFPAIYDLAVSSDYPTAAIGGPAIFHLHGQHSGFMLMNTENEVKKNAKRMRDIFKKIDTNRPWIVCGYSGDCDPVVDQLVHLKTFHGNLFWVGYCDSTPGATLQKQLLSDGQHRWVSGYDADGFFTTLAQKLGDLKPGYVTQPFSHLLELIKPVMEFSPSPAAQKSMGPTGGLMEQARATIQQAIDQLEQKTGIPRIYGVDDKGAPSRYSPIALTMADAAPLYLSGEYEKLLRLVEENARDAPAIVKNLAAEAAIAHASQCYLKASSTADDEALLHTVIGLATRAQNLAPEMPWSYLVEASCLVSLAEKRTGNQREQIYQEAFAKYARATEIKPDFHEAFYHWGNGLGHLARTKDGPERETLFRKAFAKYARATEIKSDYSEAFYSYGNALGDLAQSKDGPEREGWLQEAIARYTRVTEIKPDDHKAFNNWGNALRDLAQTKDAPERDALYGDAFAKYVRAIEFQPDDHVAFNNWGIALGNLARTKDGPERDTLFREAVAKFARAAEIKPDDHTAFNNWGIALSNLARTKGGPEREPLFREAFAKYAHAAEIKPDYSEAFYNWGTALQELARSKDGPEREALIRETFAKYARVTEIEPDDHNAFNNWGAALNDLAQSKDGAERDALFQEAIAKCACATEIKPDDHKAFDNWGISLIGLALTKDRSERERLLAEAESRLTQANMLSPSTAVYNLACLAALRGQLDRARVHLEEALSLGVLPNRAHLESEAHLNSLRNLPWFSELLEKTAKS